MNVNYLKAFGCAIFMAFVLFMVFIVLNYFISLIFMADKIKFSASAVICLISSPMLIYATIGCAFFFIFGRLPKHNKIIVKYLTILMLSSFTLGPPISLYVDYMLKNDGYLVCDRISWMSPTTYVTDLSLC